MSTWIVRRKFPMKCWWDWEPSQVGGGPPWIMSRSNPDPVRSRLACTDSDCKVQIFLPSFAFQGNFSSSTCMVPEREMGLLLHFRVIRTPFGLPATARINGEKRKTDINWRSDNPPRVHRAAARVQTVLPLDRLVYLLNRSERGKLRGPAEESRRPPRLDRVDKAIPPSYRTSPLPVWNLRPHLTS